MRPLYNMLDGIKAAKQSEECRQHIAHLRKHNIVDEDYIRKEIVTWKVAEDWPRMRQSMTRDVYEYIRDVMEYWNHQDVDEDRPKTFSGLEEVAKRFAVPEKVFPKPATICDHEWRALSEHGKEFTHLVCTENDRMDMEKGLPPKYFPVGPNTSAEGQAPGDSIVAHTNVPPPLDTLHGGNEITVQQPQHALQNRNIQESAAGSQTTAPPRDVIDLVSPIYPPAAMTVKDNLTASPSTQARNAQDAAVDSQIELDQHRREQTTPTQLSERNDCHTPPAPQKSSGASRKRKRTDTAADAGQATDATSRAPKKTRTHIAAAPSRQQQLGPQQQVYGITGQATQRGPASTFEPLLAKAAAHEQEYRSHVPVQAPPVQATNVANMVTQARAHMEACETITAPRTQASRAQQLEAVHDQINRDKQAKQASPGTPQQISAQFVRGAPQPTPETPSMTTAAAETFSPAQVEWAEMQSSNNAAFQGQAAFGPSNQMPSVPQGMWNTPDPSPAFVNPQQVQYKPVTTTPSPYTPQRAFTHGQQSNQQTQPFARHQTPQPAQRRQKLQHTPQQVKKEMIRNSSNSINPVLFERMQALQAAQEHTRRIQMAQGSPQQREMAQTHAAQMRMAQKRDVKQGISQQRRIPNMVPGGPTATAAPPTASASAFLQPGQLPQMPRMPQTPQMGQSVMPHQQLQMSERQWLQFMSHQQKSKTQMQMMGNQQPFQMNFQQQPNMGYQQRHPQMGHQQQVPFVDSQRHPQMYFQQNAQMYFQQHPQMCFQQQPPQMNHQQQASFMDFQQYPQMYFPQQPSMGSQQPVQSMSPQQQGKSGDQQTAQLEGTQQQQSQIVGQQQPQTDSQLPQMADTGMAQSKGGQQPDMGLQPAQGLTVQQPAQFMGEEQQQPQMNFPQQPNMSEEDLMNLFPELSN